MFVKEPHVVLKVIFLSLFSLFLMLIDWHLDIMRSIRRVLFIPIVGVEYLVSWPTDAVKYVQSIAKTQSKLISENKKLTEKLLVLQAEVQQVVAIKAENKQLRALLTTAKKIKGKVIAAEILSIKADPFSHQLLINRGSSLGVFVGQTVLDAYGILGQVIEVNKFTSRVLLIDDLRSGVPVQVVRNGMRAIATGDNKLGGLNLVNVSQTADILLGDILVTSGIGDNYPAGFLLGRVSSVLRVPDLEFATIKVVPIAHLNQGTEVLLLWPDKHLDAEEKV